MGLFLMAAIDWDATLAMAWTIFKVAAGLGFVIFVHELGHFLVAKMCGVKCEKFYVGFDIPIKIGRFKLSRLARFQWGETEYGIGILPLGGYVKMLGQDDDPRNAQREAERIRIQKPSDGQQQELAGETPHARTTRQDTADEQGAKTDQTAKHQDRDEELPLDPRSFPAKSVPKRMAIISAGVVMNLIFAVIFAAFAFNAGVSYVPTEIGATVPGSPAWQAGLEPGSKIIQIGEDSRRSEHLRFTWDLRNAGVGMAQDKEDLKLLLRTPDGDTRWASVRPVLTEQGKAKIPMIGVAPTNTTEIADVRPHSAAADASPSLKSGDRIIAVNGQSIENAVQLRELLALHPDEPLEVTVEREGEDEQSGQPRTETIQSTVEPNPIKRLGLVMQYGPVTGIRPDSPADRAGFEVGDRLLTVAGQPMADPMSLPTQLKEHYGREIPVEVRRGDERVELQVTPEQPRSFDWGLSPGFPMAAESLGIAYEVKRTVEAVKSDGPAADSKLQAGDTFVSVQFASDDQKKRSDRLINDGKPVELSEDGFGWIFVMSQIQYLGPDAKLRLTYQRDGREAQVVLKPQATDQFNPDRGIALKAKSEIHSVDSWTEAMILGFRQTKEDATRVLHFLQKLITGAISPTNLGGPLSIAAVAGSEASQGIPRLLMFLTFLSANLAVLNFLPIPALDGGHMLFLIAEGVRGKPVDERTQMALTLAGVACLLGLMIFVFGLDIHRLFL